MRLKINLPGKTGLGAFALGLAMGFSATTVDALTVEFSSSDGSSFLINDNGANDEDNGLRSIGRLTSFTVGGFTIGSIVATANDAGGSSTLQTTSLIVSGGNPEEFLTVRTTSDDFFAGANKPDTSDVFYSLGGSVLRGTLEGSGTVGETVDGIRVEVTTDTLSFDPAIKGTGSFSGDSQTLAIVGNPFDMTTTLVFGQQTGVGSNVNSTLDTSPLPVPLPAGGLLLLSALGGVATLRRRRKAV